MPHDSTPPPWPGSPQPSPPPYVNGHGSADLMLGTLLGGLQAGQERTIYVMERIYHQLETLPDRLADKMPPAAPKPSEKLNAQDWLKIAIGLVALGMVIAGKLTLPQVAALIGK